MNKLLLSILVVFIIASCEDTPSASDKVPEQDTFTPYTVGFWDVTTADKAEYIGQQNSKAKVDTQLITTPEEITFTISNGGTTNTKYHPVNFTFIDSSLSYSVPNDGPGDITIAFYAPGHLVNPYRTAGSLSRTFNDGILALDGVMSFNCINDIPPIEDQVLDMLVWDDVADSLLHLYQFRIDGMAQVIDSTFCTR